MRTPPPNPYLWSSEQQRAYTDRLKDEWIQLAKCILISIQLRDNLDKTVVVQDYNSGKESRILLKPKSSFDLEEGSFA